MRRPTLSHSTTHLPRKLRDELGLPDTYNPDSQAPNRARGAGSGAGSGGGAARKYGNGGPASSRKDRRRSEREDKKVSRRPDVKKPSQSQGQGQGQRDGKRDDGRGGLRVQKATKKGREEVADEFDVSDEELDDDVLNEDDDDDEETEGEQDTENEEEEVATRPKVSRAVQDKLEQDDAEIAALQKALGIKDKKKLPQAFKDDGLDEIMGDLGEDSDASDGKKRKREGDEWLQRKRQKALAGGGDGDEDDDDESGDSEGGDVSAASYDDDDDEGSFDGFDDEPEPPPPKKKVKENPYVAPVAPTATSTSTTTTKKYVPPSLRAASASTSATESESLARLRRQTQGHLNKLSEANLLTIVSEIEKLYQSHPRQNVTTTLIDVLLALICDRSSLNDSFINLHAGFIAAGYKVVGMDFGAQLVQQVVERFDVAYEEQRQQQQQAGAAGGSKEVGNLITLLSHLYNLYVVGRGLVFDYIRLFLEEINELNTELLLKVIKSMYYVSLSALSICLYLSRYLYIYIACG